MKNRFFAVGTFLLVITLSIGAIGGRASMAKADGPYVTLNSFSGHPGTILQVSGGGYVPGETINIYFGSASGTPAATTTAAADTSFGPISATVPLSSPQGALQVLAVGATQSTNSYYVVPLTPSVTVTSSANTPFSAITVNGSGFGANEAVTLSIAGASANSTANALGSFTAGTVTIPNVTPGVYLLRGTGQISNAQSDPIYFYVGAFYPNISPSAYYVLPGGTLSFSGSGYGNGETVSVTEGANPTALSHLVPDSSGTFSASGTITVPFAFANSMRTFTLTGATTHAQSSTTVTIGQFFPSVTPSNYYITPGTSLSFSGGGFANNEIIDVFNGNNTTKLATFTSGTSGTYLAQGTFTVPFGYAGQTPTFRLVGETSHATATTQVTIGQLYPTISPSAYYILPGQTLTLSGSGFAPNETLDILYGASSTHVTADALGSFANADVVVPFTSLTYLNISAIGETSHANSALTITLGSYSPSVAPSSYYLLPGSQISFTGSNFAPNESISVTSGTNTLGTITATSLGALGSNSFQIPFGTTGTQTFGFTGTNSTAHTDVSITLAPFNASATSDNYYVLPGSTVNITGQGFAAGESVTATTGTFSATKTADALGNTGIIPVTIPFGTIGSTTITLTGQHSHAAASVTITLASFYPSVSPSTYYTAPGASVTFTGTGFAANELVNIMLGTKAAGTVTSDALGNISSAPITIPYSTAGSAHFSFSGVNSQTPTSTDIGLSGFYAGVALSNYYAVGGTPITITGSGFAPNENVSLTFGSTTLTPATANSGGAFSALINVPYAIAGTKTVTATGALSGAAASTTFTQAPVYVSASLGAYHGSPGSTIDFMGSGYLPNEPITITTDRTGTAAVHSFSADTSGMFTDASYIIPAAFTEGNLTLTVNGEHSLTPLNIVFYVNQ